MDKLRQYFPNLLSGNLSSGIEIAGIVLVGALLWYIFFVKKNHMNPLWGLFVLLMSSVIFAGFFIGGIRLGKIFGIDEMGAFIGIFAFFIIASIYKYYSTPKDQRRRRMF